MQNCETIGQLKQILWTNEILRDLSLRWVSDGYPVLHSIPGSVAKALCHCLINIKMWLCIQWSAFLSHINVTFAFITCMALSCIDLVEPGEAVSSVTIGSGNGLSPVLCQTITWASAYLEWCWPTQRRNSVKIGFRIQKFSLKMQLKMSHM